MTNLTKNESLISVIQNYVSLIMNNCLYNSFYVRLDLDYQTEVEQNLNISGEERNFFKEMSIIYIYKQTDEESKPQELALLRRNMFFRLALRQQRKNNDLET